MAIRNDQVVFLGTGGKRWRHFLEEGGKRCFRLGDSHIITVLLFGVGSKLGEHVDRQLARWPTGDDGQAQVERLALHIGFIAAGQRAIRTGGLTRGGGISAATRGGTGSQRRGGTQRGGALQEAPP